MIHKDHTGKTSMMRVGFMACLIVGGIMCLSGVIAVFSGKDGSVMMTTGGMLMGSSGWAKAVQSKWEKTSGNAD